MAFLTGYSFFSLRDSKKVEPRDVIEINNLKKEFLKNVSPKIFVDLSGLYYAPGQGEELLSPSFDLGRKTTQKSLKVFSSRQNCFTDLLKFKRKNSINKLSKSYLWERFRCGLRSSLPNDFFDTPPYLHPSGYSYALLAFKSQYPIFQKGWWIESNLPFFHLQELQTIKEQIPQTQLIYTILANLDKHSLESLMKKRSSILTPEYLMIKRKGKGQISPRMAYYIYLRDDLDRFLDNSDYRVEKVDLRPGCHFKDGDICWRLSFNRIFSKTTKWMLFICFGTIFLMVMVLITLYNKIRKDNAEEKRRRLALQVLTHEFRTPVTDMLLLINKIDKNIDCLNAETQENFMRLSSDVYRLQRLSETSRHYLKASSQGKSNRGENLIDFKVEKIPSVNEFILDQVDLFQNQLEGQISLNLLEPDQGFSLDTYWVGVCLKNLIENALSHGVLPIEITAKIKNDSLVMIVQDSGPGPERSFEEICSEFVKGNLSQGSGLGLNIVNKVIISMNGLFKFNSNKKNKTQFIIELKDLK